MVGEFCNCMAHTWIGTCLMRRRMTKKPQPKLDPATEVFMKMFEELYGATFCDVEVAEEISSGDAKGSVKHRHKEG